MVVAVGIVTAVEVEGVLDTVGTEIGEDRRVRQLLEHHNTQIDGLLLYEVISRCTKPNSSHTYTCKPGYYVVHMRMLCTGTTHQW